MKNNTRNMEIHTRFVSFLSVLYRLRLQGEEVCYFFFKVTNIGGNRLDYWLVGWGGLEDIKNQKGTMTKCGRGKVRTVLATTIKVTHNFPNSVNQLSTRRHTHTSATHNSEKVYPGRYMRVSNVNVNL